jgi:hypothetical protein
MPNAYFTIFYPLNPFPHKHHPPSPTSYAHHPPQIEHPPSMKKNTKYKNPTSHHTLATKNKPNAHNGFNALSITNSHLQHIKHKKQTYLFKKIYTSPL